MKKFKRNQYSLLIILLFFTLMAWFSLSWSQLSILEMKSIDEYAFHGSLLRFYEGLISFDIKKMFSLGFYSYGSVFFILNGIIASPWLGETGSSVAIILPRLINIFFMVTSLYFLNKLSEQFYIKTFEKILTLLFVIIMPGIWFNAMWFHPDYMMITFLMASMYELSRSSIIGDRFYWTSIILWAISVAVKIQAITFSPVLIWSIFILIRKNEFNTKYLKIFVSSIVLFVLIFVLFNPYILHPKGANAWLQFFISNIQSNASNHGNLGNLSLIFKMEYAIENFYVSRPLFLIMFVLSLIAIFKEWNSKQLRLGGMVAIFILSNSAYLLFFVNKAWNHYFLPVFMISPLIFVFGIKLFSDYFQLKTIWLRSIFILLVAIQAVTFSPILKDLVELRMNGGAISLDSLNRYETKIVYESHAKEQEKEVYKLIKNSLKHETVFLKSPFLPFPYKDSQLPYNHVRIIFGPLSTKSFERKISRSGIVQKEATHILIKKDDIYFDENKIKMMVESDAYEIAKKTIRQWILGKGRYKLINQSSCCYLFEKNKKA